MRTRDLYVMNDVTVVAYGVIHSLYCAVWLPECDDLQFQLTSWYEMNVDICKLTTHSDYRLITYPKRRQYISEQFWSFVDFSVGIFSSFLVFL